MGLIKGSGTVTYGIGARKSNWEFIQLFHQLPVELHWKFRGSEGSDKMDK